MNSTPRSRSPFTAPSMSFTVSATCWTPSPRWSSWKSWICEAWKSGRQGSLFANFTPEWGSRITTERSPEPWAFMAASRWRVTSAVWNCTSQNSSKPSTCSIQRSAGFMVRKLEVTWSMCPKPKRFAPPRGSGWRTR